MRDIKIPVDDLEFFPSSLEAFLSSFHSFSIIHSIDERPRMESIKKLTEKKKLSKAKFVRKIVKKKEEKNYF